MKSPKKTKKKNPTTSYYAFIFIICIYNFFVNIDLWISLAWDQETLWDLLRSNPYSTQNLHTKFSGEDQTYKPSHLWIKFYIPQLGVTSELLTKAIAGNSFHSSFNHAVRLIIHNLIRHTYMYMYIFSFTLRRIQILLCTSFLLSAMIWRIKIYNHYIIQYYIIH